MDWGIREVEVGTWCHGKQITSFLPLLEDCTPACGVELLVPRSIASAIAGSPQ
jgi:hypothetical protein